MSDNSRPRYRGLTVLLIEGQDKDTLYRLKKNVAKERLFINHKFNPFQPGGIEAELDRLPDGSVFVYTNYRNFTRDGGRFRYSDVNLCFPVTLEYAADRLYIGNKKCRGMFTSIRSRYGWTGERVSRRDLIGY